MTDPAGGDFALDEFDDAGELCGAVHDDGRHALGRLDHVIAQLTGRAGDDPWVVAVEAAVHRDRSWPQDRRSDLAVWQADGEMFHVSLTSNRESIEEHGLDWRKVGEGQRGIANGAAPELPVVFLCESLEEADFFVGMSDASTDLWAADVTGMWLESGPVGWALTCEAIPPDRLRLVER